MAVKHAFVSGLADGADTTLVRPSNWDADHTVENSTITNDMLAGSIAASKLVGTDIATVGTVTTGTWASDITLKDESVSADGEVAFNRTTEELNYHNGQRALSDEVGWTATAFSIGGGAHLAYSTAVNLAANGGSVAVQVLVTGHMLFDSLMIRNTDTATARAAEWRLYRQRLNNGNAGENTLDEVPNANGTFSFTPTAASNRTSQAGTVPIYLAPGCYWLVIRNTDGSNTFGLGTNGNIMTPSLHQTKTLASALGATLDFVAATWTKSSATFGTVLMGRVFGQTALF